MEDPGVDVWSTGSVGAGTTVLPGATVTGETVPGGEGAASVGTFVPREGTSVATGIASATVSMSLGGPLVVVGVTASVAGVTVRGAGVVKASASGVVVIAEGAPVVPLLVLITVGTRPASAETELVTVAPASVATVTEEVADEVAGLAGEVMAAPGDVCVAVTVHTETNSQRLTAAAVFM